MFKKYLIACLMACSLHAANPESRLIIIENFISQDAARELIAFFNQEQRGLNQHTDNQLALSSATNGKVRDLVSSISRQVLQVMGSSYGLNPQKYHVDHAGLYARVTGNACSYHADNVYFECPVHGRDQSRLRKLCDGKCLGAKFIPNHTSWREYTALIYLNDQFEGGEIVFEDGPQNKQYRKVIPIKACMLVLAPNGPDFYHEVLRIRKGTRYSLHLWYTSDTRYRNSYLY